VEIASRAVGDTMMTTAATMTLDNLSNMTLVNLKKLAKDMNVSFASKIRKADLIDLILTAQALDDDPIKEEAAKLEDMGCDPDVAYEIAYEKAHAGSDYDGEAEQPKQAPTVKIQEYVDAHTLELATIEYVVLDSTTKSKMLNEYQSRNKNIISVFNTVDNTWGVVLANGAIYKVASEANKLQLIGYLKHSEAMSKAMKAAQAAQQKAQQQTAEKAAEEIIGNITNDKPQYSHKDVDMITGHNIRKAVEWQRQQHSAISEWEKSHKEKVQDSLNVKPDRKAEAAADAVLAKQANAAMAVDDAALKAVVKAGDVVGGFLGKIFNKKNK
jgi:hypothetical protein